MHLPNNKVEIQLFRQGYTTMCAVDEVGVGCLAGPVVACSVLVTKKFYTNEKLLSGIRDSKLLSPTQRDRMYTQLTQCPDITYATAYALPKTIDRDNIYNATRNAMKRAVNKILQRTKKTKNIVLVDGPRKLDGLSAPQQAIVRGDQSVIAIAAASIIAKVYRDRMMVRYAKRFPEYGFEMHKGYGTPMHRASLTIHGPCALHRKTFAFREKIV